MNFASMYGIGFVLCFCITTILIYVVSDYKPADAEDILWCVFLAIFWPLTSLVIFPYVVTKTTEWVVRLFRDIYSDN